MHSKMDDQEIPEGVAIFGTDGDDDACTILDFDVRGVARRYDVALHADGFTWSRDDPQFPQRFSVTIASLTAATPVSSACERSTMRP